MKCHISNSPHWQAAQLFKLTTSLRHDQDEIYSKFLMLVREKAPLKAQIEAVLSTDRFTAEEDVVRIADEKTTILCSHQDLVQQYNRDMHNKFFQQPDVTSCTPVLSSVSPALTGPAEPEVQKWAQDPAFHGIPQADVGTRVLIYLAPATDHGAACPYNLGDQGHITELHMQHCSTTPFVEAISVRLIKDGSVHTFTRTISAKKSFHGTSYTRATFPLRVCIPKTVGLLHNCGTDATFKEWLAKEHFHTLTDVSIGSKIMLTANINLKQGAANGAIGTVLDITYDDNQEIRKFTVLLPRTGAVIPVYRLSYASMYKNSKRYDILRQHS